MKRRLIDFGTFNQLSKSSVLNAEHELTEAANVIAKMLDVDGLRLHGFTNEAVLYETFDNSFVYANYDMNENTVTFNNVEELVINEDSEKEHAKEILTNMIDALIENNDKKAEELFDNYIHQRIFKENISESFRTQEMFKTQGGKKKSAGFRKARVHGSSRRRTRGKAQPESLVHKRVLGRRKASHLETPSERARHDRERAKVGGSIKTKKFNPRKKMAVECALLSENVLGYCDYVEYGPVIEESVVQHDDKGNVKAIKIPSTKVRNEGKILKFNWKTLDHEVKVLREQAMRLHENKNFCSAILKLKRNTNLVDNEGAVEAVENIVSDFPQVLFLTQNELSLVIESILSSNGVKNYDDNTCIQLSENILRMAHNSYTNKVEKIMHLAGAKLQEDSKDAYVDFQEIVNGFYPHVDDTFKIEMSVFADLYGALESIYHEVSRQGDEVTKDQVTGYLNELASVLDGKTKADTDLAEEVALWLAGLVETNLETDDWTVSNTPHMTVSGDHPAMAEKAKVSYSPSADLNVYGMSGGGPGGAMIGQDDMNYKSGKFKDEAAKRSWGNIGGDGTYPALQNPYVPKPFGDYTMKGEPGADKEVFGQHWSSWQSSDTWPNLQNPYQPKSPWDKSSYKMKSDNLVVDK